MKETVQIKALLVEGRHDALLAFIERYNKLFANKLLLRICEGVLPKYTPTLALFDDRASAEAKEGRTLNIKIHKASSPLMFQFYESLPFGTRMPVMVNLMNHYVQLVEADKKLMENLYWNVAAPKPEATQPQPESLPQTPQVHTPVKGDEWTAHTVNAGNELAKAMAAPISSRSSNEIEADPTPIIDPLREFDTGL